jgi:hypothetical protein
MKNKETENVHPPIKRLKQRLFRHTMGCGGPLLTLILTGRIKAILTDKIII